MTTFRLCCVAILLLVVAAPTRAHADDQPWAKGVPAAQQDKANALFDEGNQLFAQQAHAPALEKYRAAVALWDHPLIRFNLAVTLIRLDRVLEAADELESALRFGAAPFNKELYQQALDYQALIKRQVGYIDATCNQSGAHVLLDGKPWFSCPGQQKQRVMAGEHAIVGELHDYLTSSQRIVVGGGATISETVKLIPLESAVVLTYRYQRWIPWTISAGGVALGLAGLATWLSGRSEMDDFNRDYGTMCPAGCSSSSSGPHPISSLLADESSRAEFKGKVGIGLMVGGGAVLIGGAAMAILNRPQRHLPNVEVAPTSGGAISSIGWSF